MGGLVVPENPKPVSELDVELGGCGWFCTQGDCSPNDELEVPATHFDEDPNNPGTPADDGYEGWCHHHAVEAGITPAGIIAYAGDDQYKTVSFEQQTVPVSIDGFEFLIDLTVTGIRTTISGESSLADMGEVDPQVSAVIEVRDASAFLADFNALVAKHALGES